MQTMPSIGDKAPEINAKAYFPEDKDIKEFHLEAYKGKWVILTFYPGDFTFVCATDVEAFMGSLSIVSPILESTFTRPRILTAAISLPSKSEYFMQNTQSLC